MRWQPLKKFAYWQNPFKQTIVANTEKKGDILLTQLLDALHANKLSISKQVGNILRTNKEKNLFDQTDPLQGIGVASFFEATPHQQQSNPFIGYR